MDRELVEAASVCNFNWFLTNREKAESYRIEVSRFYNLDASNNQSLPFWS